MEKRCDKCDRIMEEKEPIPIDSPKCPECEYGPFCEECFEKHLLSCFGSTAVCRRRAKKLGL